MPKRNTIDTITLGLFSDEDVSISAKIQLNWKGAL